VLDVTRLRVLVAVARQGSVTAAARELNYAQPSISHHLARLEAETGVKLIQRAGRGIRLTDAGRLLADRAAEVLGRLDAAENEIAAHVGLRRGRVRLAAFASALGTIVPVAAARLQAEHPGLEITLTEAEPPEALRMLRAGYVDVALVFRHEPGPDSSAPRARLLLDEPVFLVTPASRPRPDGPDLAAYAGERWIAGCERCRNHLLERCARAGFTPDIAFTTDDYVAVQALVAAGLGITTLPGLALRAARHRGVRATPLPGARRYVYAATYGAPPDPLPTARLLDALTAAASSPEAPGDPDTGNPGTTGPGGREPGTAGPPGAVPAGTVSAAAGGAVASS
jgi:DNA-binding transcriptional LysR family regulator